MSLASSIVAGTADVLERFSVALRAFVTGNAIVQNTDRVFGHDNDTFTPEKYGSYIATSNAVYTCATMRADLLSGLPLRAWKTQPGDNAKPVEKPNAKSLALLNYVNPFWSGNRLIRMTELSLCLWGKNVWFIERGKSGVGEPKEIWWARPDRVRLVPDPVNYIKEFRYRPMNGGEDLVFMPSETVWMPYANPMDEFEGLSPIAAARLAAEYGTAAMQSNRNLFANGLQMGGFVMPKTGNTINKESAEQLEEDLDRRFKGVDKAHRWAIMRNEYQINANVVTPKDAEFVKGQALALEDVCRAYHVPPDIVGGQRTYANVESAMVGLWDHCVIPEAKFITSELVEKYLPMFPGEADILRFDTGNIAVLTEARGRIVDQVAKLWSIGVPLNKLLREFFPSLLPDDAAGYAWGDKAWVLSTTVPIGDDGLPIMPKPAALPAPAPTAPAAEPPPADAKPAPKAKTALLPARRMVAYGSDEHERLWRQFARRMDSHEKTLGAATADLFKRQKDSILARLNGRAKRDPADVAEQPFDKAEWVKRFRVEVRPIIQEIVDSLGQAALEDIGVNLSFDVTQPEVARFLEQRTQRFAKEVNDTTWNDLKASLSEGMDAGEGIGKLADRVDAVMGDRIASSAEVIARTEVVGASNGGTMMAWRQSDVVESKAWLATLDSRTRDDHVEAHDRYQTNPIPLDEDFEVGDATGPGPGMMGDPSEDCNCRCTMTAVLKEAAHSVARTNGHWEMTHA